MHTLSSHFRSALVLVSILFLTACGSKTTTESELRSLLERQVKADSGGAIVIRRFAKVTESRGSESGREFVQVNYKAELEFTVAGVWLNNPATSRPYLKVSVPPPFSADGKLARLIQEDKWHQQNPGSKVAQGGRSTINGIFVLIPEAGSLRVVRNTFEPSFEPNPWILPDEPAAKPDGGRRADAPNSRPPSSGSEKDAQKALAELHKSWGWPESAEKVVRQAIQAHGGMAALKEVKAYTCEWVDTYKHLEMEGSRKILLRFPDAFKQEENLEKDRFGNYRPIWSVYVGDFGARGRADRPAKLEAKDVNQINSSAFLHHAVLFLGRADAPRRNLIKHESNRFDGRECDVLTFEDSTFARVSFYFDKSSHLLIGESHSIEMEAEPWDGLALHRGIGEYRKVKPEGKIWSFEFRFEFELGEFLPKKTTGHFNGWAFVVATRGPIQFIDSIDVGDLESLARGEGRPPAPLTPAQREAILWNLQQISQAIVIWSVDRQDAKKATWGQLVRGHVVGFIDTVVGESYDGPVYEVGKPVSVTTPFGETVTYTPPKY